MFIAWTLAHAEHYSDRVFHAMETTWNLSSSVSNSDVKELIPEFFYFPEFLENQNHFDLGVRHDGVRVDDIILPPWAKGDPRFVRYPSLL